MRMSDSQIAPEARCPHCSGVVPSDATRCVHCHRSLYVFEMTPSADRARSKFWPKLWFLAKLLAGAFCLFIVYALYELSPRSADYGKREIVSIGTNKLISHAAFSNMPWWHNHIDVTIECVGAHGERGSLGYLPTM